MLAPEFIRIIEALADVRGVIVGGVAMSAHGSAYITVNFDLAYERSDANLKTLAQVLAKMHARLRDVSDHGPIDLDWLTLRNGTNFPLATDLGDIYLLSHAAYEELERGALKINVGQVTARVASIDDLISMKRAANRPKDQAHLYELLALKKLIEEGQ